MLENGEYKQIDNKRKELDKLLKKYIENFKQKQNTIVYEYNSFIQFKNFDNINKKVRWYK